MSNEKTKSGRKKVNRHGGPRPNSGRPKGRKVETFALVARPADHKRWRECAQAEGIPLSRWIAERCGDITAPGLSRMHERLVALAEERGEKLEVALHEWRLLAAAWLERSKAEAEDVRERLAACERVR